MSDIQTPPPEATPPAAPPAAPPVAPPAAPPAPPAAPPSADPWWGKPDLGLDQDTANFYAGRNAPSLAEALKSGMNAHKAVTDRNVIPKPDPAKPHEWSGWKEMGWPEQRADYKIESLKGKAPEGYGYDEGTESAFLDACHELHVLPSVAQALLERTMGKSFESYSALATEMAREEEQTKAALRAEWGNQYAAKEELGKRAFRWAGGDKADIAALEAIVGAPGLIKMFAKIGEAFGEERLVLTADGGGLGGRSETTIRAELNQIEGDPAQYAILMDPRHARHRELNDKRNRLIDELAKVAVPR